MPGRLFHDPGGDRRELRSETPWVFVSPTYSWQLPRVMRDLIRRSSFSGSRDAYFVMTCGEDVGAAAQWNRRLCGEAGLRDRGTCPVVMPENYIALFRAPEETEAREIVAGARPVLEEGRRQDPAGRGVCARPDRHAGPAEIRPGQQPVLPLLCADKPFAVSDACVSCGRCERSCPLGNIRLESGRPVWGDRLHPLHGLHLRMPGGGHRVWPDQPGQGPAISVRSERPPARRTKTRRPGGDLRRSRRPSPIR